MNVSFSMGWLSVDHCVGSPVISVPAYHLCVKKRESSVFSNSIVN